MTEEVFYIDRQNGTLKREEVYGGTALSLLYGKSWWSRLIGSWLKVLIKLPLFSKAYGWLQSRSFTRYKIAPFIQRFAVDPTEFLEPPSSFHSFNDFFIRKLKKEARPIDERRHVAIIPADGRYLFYEKIDEAQGFFVKGQKFCLKELLQNEAFANEYKSGSLVIGRLAPPDYHRFHFPCDVFVEKSHLVNGPLSSVNPMALKRNIAILTENKRVITRLKSREFGDFLYVEVGATFVGSIIETCQPHSFQPKGGEKGYFAFGGSALLLLFQKGSIAFEEDLLVNSRGLIETKCLMGQAMGTCRFLPTAAQFGEQA